MIQNIVYIGLGSAVGGILRFLIAGGIQKVVGHSFPFGTLAVNALGSFLIGFLFIYLSARFTQHAIKLDALLVVGFLGGFTTFSAFSLQTIQLFESRSYFQAILYVTLSVFICLLLTYGGVLLGKKQVQDKVQTSKSV